MELSTFAWAAHGEPPATQTIEGHQRRPSYQYGPNYMVNSVKIFQMLMMDSTISSKIVNFFDWYFDDSI